MGANGPLHLLPAPSGRAGSAPCSLYHTISYSVRALVLLSPIYIPYIMPSHAYVLRPLLPVQAGAAQVMAVADKCLVDGADETLQLLDVACQVWKGGGVRGTLWECERWEMLRLLGAVCQVWTDHEGRDCVWVGAVDNENRLCVLG